MKITTDFECGNGKDIKETPGNNFSFETSGDSSSYACYFCVRVTNEKETPDTCRLHVRWDSAIEYGEGDRESFRKGRIPFWRGSDGKVWRKLVDYERSDLTWHVGLRLKGGESVIVSNMIPLPYTRMAEKLRREYQSGGRAALHVVGRSFKSREMLLLSIGKFRPGKRRILIMSGLHGIEFPGIWAAKGIIEFLLSGSRTARRILEHFVVDVIPHGNPDGTCRGLQQTNAQGTDIYRFSNLGQKALAPELGAFRNWIEKNPPALYINLHGWFACETGKEPYEGAYRPSTSVYAARKLDAVVADCDRLLIKHAHPISRHDRIKEFDGVQAAAEPDNLLNFLAVRYGTIAYCYEPNMRTGLKGCQAKGVKILKALSAGLL